MKLQSYLYLVVALLLGPLVVSCAAGPDDGATSGTDRDLSTPEERSEVVEVFPVDSGAAGGGANDPRIFVTDSLESLRDVARLAPTESTSGEEGATYVAAFWGEKRTGGYTVEVGSASLTGETVTVVLRLQEPPEGAIVSQALTYPYSVFGLADVDPATTEFVFEDQDGERLDWPTRNLSSP